MSQTTIDLFILPLNRQEGFEQPGLPGLYMVTPPNRTARGRGNDRLILHLTLSGNLILPEKQQEQILERLARSYYKIPGATTSALRTLAEDLNKSLLESNLNSSNSGKQCIGLLSMVMLRGEMVTIAQCGPIHAYLITAGDTQHLYDPQIAGRGLGFGRAISIRYYQFGFHANDLLLLSAQPSPTWSDTALQGAQNQGIESMRRRLLSQAGPDLKAVLIQAQTGTGKLRFLRTKAPSPASQPGETPEPVISAPPTTPDQDKKLPEEGLVIPETYVSTGEKPVTPSDQDRQEEDSSAESTSQVTSPMLSNPEPDLSLLVDRVPSDQTSTDKQDLTGSITGISEAPVAPTTRPVRQTTGFTKQVVSHPSTPTPHPLRSQTDQNQPGVQPTPIAKTKTAHKGSTRVSGKILGIFSWLGNGAIRLFKGLVNVLQSLLRKILPDESVFTIPASMMIFIAAAVAVTFATAGGYVYFQRGRAAQYQNYYKQADASAQQARKQTDPIELKTAWETTLDYLDKADSYQISPQSQTLRAEAIAAIDKIDQVDRLDFQPAIVGGLDESNQITRIIATNTDLYLLNAKGGNVIRATLTGRGYERDPNFNCGPNPKVGPLIDITLLPRGNNLNATLLGIDNNGTLLFCMVDDLPTMNQPAPPPTNWTAPRGIKIDNGNLYVLDPQTNGVWVYRNMDMINQPHLFFGDDIPPMHDVVDLALNQDDLYLLHSDGHLTLCVYSTLKESPTRCKEPVTYTDARKGRQNGPIIQDARFSQIFYKAPPDPSLFMLDPVFQAVYHFSMKLTFRHQFRSINPLPAGEATAFTITPNNMILLAIGHYVYYAPMP